MIIILKNLAKIEVCAAFHSRVIWRSVSPKFIELCINTTMSAVKAEGRRICHRILLFKRKFITLEFRHIEISTSVEARTVQLVKSYARTHLIDLL